MVLSTYPESTNVLILFSDHQLSAFLFQSNSSHNIVVKEEDLNIVVIDKDDIKKSVNYLEHKMKSRTRVNQEFWFVDITTLGKVIFSSPLLGPFPGGEVSFSFEVL